MKKLILIPVLLLLILLFVFGIRPGPGMTDPPVTTTTEPATTTVTEPTTLPEPNDPVYAYFQVCEKHIQNYRYSRTYIGVNLERVKLVNTEILANLLQDYCNAQGATLLLDNYDGLVEKGYINNEDGGFYQFKDGMLITLTDELLPEGKIQLDTALFFASLAGVGNRYFLEFVDGEWKIDVSPMMWIS